jgi:DNA-damage-inducible protein J
MTTTIQVRIAKHDKSQAIKILNELGLDMSTAIKIYFKAIIQRKGVPFDVSISNRFTDIKENELLDAIEDIKKGKNISHSMKLSEAQQYLKKK